MFQNHCIITSSSLLKYTRILYSNIIIIVTRWVMLPALISILWGLHLRWHLVCRCCFCSLQFFHWYLHSVASWCTLINLCTLSSFSSWCVLGSLSSQCISMIHSWCTCTPSSQYRWIINSFVIIRNQYYLPTWTTSFSIYRRTRSITKLTTILLFCGQYNEVCTLAGHNFTLLKWTTVLFFLPGNIWFCT